MRKPLLAAADSKMNFRTSHSKRETISREEGVPFTKRTSEELRTQALFISASALTDETSKRPINALTKMMMPEFKSRTPEKETKAPI